MQNYELENQNSPIQMPSDISELVSTRYITMELPEAKRQNSSTQCLLSARGFTYSDLNAL